MTPPSPAPRLGRTLSVSGLTFASRILGLLREQLFAALLGATALADAFVVAFRIPNLLRDLFAEGALSAAFVPTFAKVEADEGRDRAYVLANRVVGGVLLVVGALAAAAMIFAAPIVSALAPGFDAGKAAVTADLARIMSPFLLLVSLAAVTMGMLNAQERFSAPAAAPAFFNVAAIATGVGLYLAGAGPRTAVVGWSIGTLVGGALQLVVQVPPAWRLGYRPRPRLAGNLADPGLRSILRLMLPATVGLAAVELNLFVNTRFASDLDGANAWLNYAFRLVYLPIGVFGVAVATVAGAGLARRAAEHDRVGLKQGLVQGIRHIVFLAVPSAVGLAVLARPIVRAIYEHGRFTAVDTEATAAALVAYAVGLVAYSGVKVLAAAFYALDRARVPLVASVSAVATNIAFNVLTFHELRHIGLALGTSLGAIVNLTILGVAFVCATRELPRVPGIGATSLKVAVGSAAMGAAVWALERWLASAVGTAGLGRQIAVVALCVGAGVATFAATCAALRVPELRELADGMRRRFGARSRRVDAGA